MSSTDLSIERGAGVAWIRFNRPEVNNAVRGETMRDLCVALDDAIASPDVKVIVLGSVGRHFVAGAEFAFLDALGAMSTAQIKSEVYAHFQGAARRLYTCLKPTIAAVNGAAVTVAASLRSAATFGW